MPETELYSERYRPQFHFTAGENWLNDPNGCVFDNGEYHLFFQHNPAGCEWGNMTWGHAVSTDLLHWQQLSNALTPYDGGTIYSGSAVVDSRNTSGFAHQASAPLVAAFTHAREPFGQAIAFSNDHGRHWEMYAEGRHVVPNQGLDSGERDPRIFWHAPTKRWVMALWVALGQVRFFVSDDLKQWVHTSDFMGEDFYECPDLFCLPLDGDGERPKWVLHDATSRYWVGDFDGVRFLPEAGPMTSDFGANFYAAQTWTNTGSRVVQIGWMRGGEYPGMPFNQQMSFPCELALRSTPAGIRLQRMPVAEIENLRAGADHTSNSALRAGEELVVSRSGDLFDIVAEIEAPRDAAFGIRLYDLEIACTGAGAVRCLGREASFVPSSDSVVRVRILLDRTSIELFVNDGEISMSFCFLPMDRETTVRCYVEQGNVWVRNWVVHHLSSVWGDPHTKKIELTGSSKT
ncbi:MAG: glycoside hydrolase family 32 protein [Phycisphaerales bacterium]|nr:glycoside hydrolase family 32 protein [Phycisphaerales bacterium]